MEQHRTGHHQGRHKTGSPLSARGAVAEAPGFPRVHPAGRGAPVAHTLRRLPNPRLTGLGAGLFATTSMLLIAYLDGLVLGGQPVVYGVLFLLVSALTALWVRNADLVTAPISVPIAFAVGTLPIAGGGGSFGGHVMGVITALAMHAGWLYGGTLVAGVIASVRKAREMARRQRARRAAALNPRARTPHGSTASRVVRRG